MPGIFIFSSLFKNESIFTPNVVTRCLNTYIFIKNKPENLKITTETQIDPDPLYFLLWYKSITFDTFLESPSIIANLKFANIQLFITKFGFLAKIVQIQKMHKMRQIIHFWKALDPANSNMQKFSILQIQNVNVYSRITDDV